MPYALILFVAMPIIEIAVLLRVGDAIGWFPTLGVVILTAILGTAMLRQQGLATLNKARERMDAGEMPAQQMLEGVLLMVGGVLLLTPGFVTDAFGFACLFPLTRHWLARRIAARATLSTGSFAGFGRTAGSHPGTTVGSGSTSGARHAGTVGAATDPIEPGGRPRPDSRRSSGRSDTGARSPDSGNVIDADFDRLDD